MSEPSSAKKFYDMILAVASQLSIADYRSNGTAMIPTDQFSFELCKDIVNDAISMFMADCPVKGWRWMRRLATVTLAITYTGTASSGTAATLVDSSIADEYADDFFNTYNIYIESGTGAGEYATITDYTGASGTFAFTALSGASTPDTTTKYSIAKSLLAINGDGSRYTLPANFGGTVDGAIDFVKGSNIGSGIEWCDEAFIRSLRAGTVHSGHPQYAAILPYQPTSETLTSTRLWEIMFYPRPSAIKTIAFPYTLSFDKMRMEMGVATNGAATAVSNSAIANIYPDDTYVGWRVSIISGTGQGATGIITDYVGADGEFFVADWLDVNGDAAPVNPAASSVYIVEPVANLHPAGHMFDDTIMAACKARAEMDEQDEHSDTFWTEAYHKKALPNAHKLDKRSAPRKLGKMLNGPSMLDRSRLGGGFTYLDSDGESVIV